VSTELLRRIEAFSIDGDPAPNLSFAARLARENGWSRPFAERAVREYKRFVYLAMAAGHPVTPSVQVDAAWHLHLTYTRSYWQRLCAETLGQPLHHEPTRGGDAEGEKFHDWYAKTLDSYRRLFGEEPPGDLWPAAETRFGEDQRFTTVNTARNWIVPKVAAIRLAGGIAVALFAVVFATGCVGGAFDPFALAGTDYLGFLISAFVGTFILGILLCRQVKGRGYDSQNDFPELRWDQVAYLNGGAAGLLSATIARLVQTGMARISDDKKQIEIAGALSADASEAERFVQKQLPIDKTNIEQLPILTSQLERLYLAEWEQFHDGGLVLDGRRRFTAGLGIVLPMVIVFAFFGLQRLVIGIQNGKPVGFLMLTLVFAAFFLFVLVKAIPTRTRKGDQLLEGLKRNHRSLKTPGSVDSGVDAGLAVALFGTAALASGELAELGAWYPRTTHGDSSGCGTTSSSSGGDGGGGCGGGGCGGCGGGD
jgi:uncharacterized protein (TIGR04222 family)